MVRGLRISRTAMQWERFFQSGQSIGLQRDVLRIRAVHVDSDDVDISVPGVILEDGLRVGVRGIHPNQVIELFFLEAVMHPAPEGLEDLRFLLSPPEPASVHLMERAPKHHDALFFQLFEARTHGIELPVPPFERLGTRLEEVVGAPSRGAVLGLPAGDGIAGMVADGHQAAQFPVAEEEFVGFCSPGTPLFVIVVVHSHEKGTLACPF